MMCGAIMQPTYLPWLGYFNLISSAEVFVFLDDVQFEKQSWQNRNRILQNGHEVWLTVPLTSAGSVCDIKDIRISESPRWKKKHVSTLMQSYAKACFSDEILSVVLPIIEKDNKFLIDLTLPIITEILRHLEITTKIVRSSELKQVGKRSEKLLNICRRLGMKTYLSPAGSRQYLDDDAVLQKEVMIKYQNYTPRLYQQIGQRDFLPYLSIVDMIANCGFKMAKKYIDDGKFE